MRYVLSVVLTLLFSFNTMAELSARDKEIADLLLSGEVKQVKVAAQRMYDIEASDPALLDIAAEILLTKYPHAYPSEIDTLAWLARALGASENPRYHSVLSEVIANTGNDKLERHAEKAQDDLPEPQGEQYVAGMYELPEGLYAQEATSERVSRIKELIRAGDLRSLKQGAREIVNTKTNSQDLNDILAEILLTHYADASKNQVDTLAWLTNAIGSSGSARYVDVLREVGENANYRKLRRYAEKNIKHLGEAQGEQYEKGMYDAPLGSYAL